MKTNLTLRSAAIILTFAALTSYGQTSWLITGNSNVTSSNFLGTTNTQPVRIKTNNAERMRIAPGGNVGIGTQTPENKLHIFKGSAGTVTGYVNAPLIVENSTASYINILAPDNTETGILFGKPQSNVSGGLIYSNSSAQNGLQFRTNGNVTRMVLTANGDLGVGTLSPDPYRAKISHSSFGFDIENNSSLDDWELVTFGSLQLYWNASFRGQFNSNDGTYSAISDERLKTNIQTMPSVLEKINQLKPVTYQFKNNKDQTAYNGFIAQDVQKVFPGLVTHNVVAERNLDVYTLNYSGFGVIAIKGIQELQQTMQEQQQKIDSQQQQINEMRQMIKTLQNQITSSSNSSSLYISSAYLKQNAPNPFSKNSVVQYYLPSTSANAQLVIYTSDGRQVKSFSLSNSGVNEVTINAGTLPSGQYIYSLLVNGKKVDSKNMIITK